ncbi:MAG: hypothetical protein C0592_07165 [Marinilabiliales bacterium]|nr:MAG: hypothetical protein C0592_07165 [Marinilabiliales bacterium]
MPDKKKKSIRNWAADDRPREKMLLKGRESLSNAELIAVLIGSGTKELSALELARELLAHFDEQFAKLSKASPKELMKIPGVGIAKAVSIVAAFELARRKEGESEHEEISIRRSDDAVKIIAPYLRDKTHEEFYMICLNQANKPLSINKIGEGGFASTLVDVRKLYRIALQDMAVGIILAHNHPSGNLSPSENDILLTMKIKRAGEIFDIKVLDHIIIGEKSYYSFTDNGQINDNE